MLVQLALGPDFHEAVPVLRVFSLWIPLTGLCTVITFQLILPSQLDSQFNIVNFTAALVNIFAALLLAPRFGAIGIAWSAVIGQIYTLLAFAVILWRAGLNPFPLSMATAVHPRPVGLAPIPARATGIQHEATQTKTSSSEFRSSAPTPSAPPPTFPFRGMTHARKTVYSFVYVVAR